MHVPRLFQVVAPITGLPDQLRDELKQLWHSRDELRHQGLGLAGLAALHQAFLLLVLSQSFDLTIVAEPSLAGFISAWSSTAGTLICATASLVFAVRYERLAPGRTA
jgi:hypothetical protein